MKKLACIILLAVMFMVGCQDDSSFLSPQEEIDVINLDEMSLNKNGDKSDLIYVYDLGDIKDFQVKASKNFKIKGKKGGKIELKVKWKYENGEKVELKAKLEIPKKAFKDEIEFDMIFNLQDYNLELYPSPFKFDNPVKLDLKFKNIDIGLFTENNFEFNYVDGKTEKIKYKKNKIDIEKRTLEVEEAELHHFSRYGWTRKK
jgi:hypothetical protein